MSADLVASNKEKIVSDLKNVVSNAEEILRATAGVAGDKVSEMRGRIEVALRDAKDRLANVECAVVDKAKAAATATDDFVHDQPWKAVGVAALVGMAIGVLISRR